MSASPLSPERTRAYGGAWIIVALGWFVVFLSNQLRLAPEARGDTDFLSFYAAAQLAWEGHAPLAWNLDAHEAAQRRVLPGGAGYYAFFYPPHYLLLCLPLAALPYLAAFAGWVLLTGGLLVAGLRRLGIGWLGVVILVFSPAGMFTAMTGQNTFLTAALLLGAGLAMEARPGRAGACLALLTVKPQLGLMVVPALLAAGRWRVVVAASAVALALMGASAAVFGLDSWWGFLLGGEKARAGMEGRLEIGQMQSVFAMARQWGAPAALAYGVQAVAAVAAVAALWPGLRRRPGGTMEAAAMAAGGMLMTPFLQFYDLALLLVPVAVVARAAAREGWLPGEALALVALLLGPWLSFLAGVHLGLSFGPVLAALAIWVLRRRMR